MQRWIAKKLKWYWENHDRLVHGYDEDRELDSIEVYHNKQNDDFTQIDCVYSVDDAERLIIDSYEFA